MLIDKVFECLKNLGIYVDLQDVERPLNSIIEDSLAYVSFIVELENVLGICIPDEFLTSGSFENLNDLVEALNPLLTEETV